MTAQESKVSKFGRVSGVNMVHPCLFRVKHLLTMAGEGAGYLRNVEMAVKDAVAVEGMY